MTGDDFIRTARTWLGTPFRHCSMSKHLACDCVGMILGVARELGLTQLELPRYSTLIDPEELRSYLVRICDPIEDIPLQAADIIVFSFSGQAIHLGLFSGDGHLLHAWERAGRVVEHPFDAFWQGHTVGRFRWRGLDG